MERVTIMNSEDGERGKILGMLWGFSMKSLDAKHTFQNEMEDAVTHYVQKYKDNPVMIEISFRFKSVTDKELTAFAKYANIEHGVKKSEHLKPNEIIIWGALTQKN